MNPTDNQPYYLHYVQYGVFFFIILNLLILNYLVIFRKPQYTLSQIRTIASVAQSVSPQKESLDQAMLEQLCDDDCVGAIRQELHNATTSAYTKFCDAACVQSIYTKIAEASAAAKSGVPSSLINQQVSASAREFFVPFGFGSSTAGDWSDVSGMQVTIDTKNYSSIKQVTFEATLRIPTGNEVAYARLYNVTDKHPVWFSDVSLEGGVPKLVISQPVTLDSGSKVYQVQMKTSLQYEAFIDQARVRIALN